MRFWCFRTRHTHELDIGPYGAPQEAYGPSNNPRVPFQALKFADAQFIYRTGRLALTIKVRYP